MLLGPSAPHACMASPVGASTEVHTGWWRDAEAPTKPSKAQPEALG